MKAMLCRDLEARDVNEVMTSREWVLESKLDGHRLIASVADGKVTGVSRRDEEHATPAPVKAALSELAIAASFDGELMSDGIYWIFDLLRCGEIVAPSDTWEHRHNVLETIFDITHLGPSIRLLPVARSRREKALLVERLRRFGHEGFVVKNVDASYQPGKRSSSWRRCKFVKRIDCVVMELGTEKQNLLLGLWDNGTLREIGECSRLEGDAPKVTVGEVIEVQILNAGSPDKPRLYQPHAKHLRRGDKVSEDCGWDQLDGCWINRTVIA